MAAGIKAIVFKTTQLDATRQFFESVLRLPLKEVSPQHFVVHSKGIRMVFLNTDKEFEVEFLVNEKPQNNQETKLKGEPTCFSSCKDPNGISIVVFPEQ